MYWLRFAALASLFVPAAHVTVLLINGLDPVTAPISALSRGPWGALHTTGLILFGAAHLALAIGAADIDRGRLWPWARLLLACCGALLVYVAWYFATAPSAQLTGPDANDPLWIVASLIGLIMGAMQPGLSRQSTGIGLFSAVCLGIWLLLVPLILLVDAAWLGAYERLVGSFYVVWMVGVSLGLEPVKRRAPQPA